MTFSLRRLPKPFPLRSNLCRWQSFDISLGSHWATHYEMHTPCQTYGESVYYWKGFAK